MYFTWEEFPLMTPEQLQHSGNPSAPVVVVGAGPVGLAVALGLARQNVASIVLERRTTISTGSRALAMTRRSMQILDQLGVGESVFDMGVKWSEGWTYYGTELVHYMDIAKPQNEKHGQTNLQQCWMEKLLLDEIAKTSLVSVRFGHEVVGIREDAEGVDIQVRTAAGDYAMQAQYLVAADGPRGTTRRYLDMDYEGTSYTQRFVINDIICKLPIPSGRRLFFSPAYLPGKAVLMHQAPFDMWRLDFQLLDDQDADEEMQPEKVHKRIRAHFDLMGLDPDYELLLTSVYKTNALSLPTYNKGRIIFAGDAAHQVPIFGGRGVNHGYADAHNLAWKLAMVVNGTGHANLLNTYTQERRGAILDTLAELTKTTLFITTPSAGIALVREAVLSLSLSENFLNNLFDPYASAPYEYTDSALNTLAPEENRFDKRCRPGAIAPDAIVGPDGQRLYDQLGYVFTVLSFVEQAGAAGARALADGLKSAPIPVKVVELAVDTDAARLFDAQAGTVYLLRPDNRVAARWRQGSARAIIEALDHATQGSNLLLETH